MNINDLLTELDEALHLVGVPVVQRDPAIEHMRGVLTTFARQHEDPSR